MNDLKYTKDIIENFLLNLNIPDVEEIKDMYKNNELICKRCAEIGWLIPSNINANELGKLMELKNDNEINVFFMKFFTKNKELNIVKLKDNFVNNDKLKKYRKPYLEAYFNYRRKQYLSSIIMLISIYEGVCADYIFQNKNSRNASGDVNKFLNERYKDKEKIIYGDKIGMKIFTQKLYCNVDFANINKEQCFNRNVLMHGRSFENIGQIENIKMMNAIDVLNNLIIEN